MYRKFKKSDHIYPKNAVFGLNTIFEQYHLSNTPIYWKVEAYYDNDTFDFCECNRKGIRDRYAGFRRGMTRQDMLILIETNQVRMYDMSGLGLYSTSAPCLPCLPNTCPTS